MDSIEVELEEGQLEGNIAPPVKDSGSGSDNTNGAYDTLDEPVLTSITRDLKAVGQKLTFVLFPKSNNSLLRDWDLWGPLFLCIYTGLLLQGMAKDSETSRFTTVFLVMWIGTVVVTYNAVFVQKATLSVFQAVCVIGYCLAPQAAVVTIFEVLHIFGVSQTFLRYLLLLASVGWSSYASFRLLQSSTEEEKKVVVIGPIVLLYATMGLLISIYVYADS